MPFTAPVAASLCSTSRECTLALPLRRAEPSPPSLSPCACPRCLYVIHSYKRDLPCAFCPCPHRCLPLISRRRCPTSIFCRSVGAKPSHPTSLPYAGPGASLSFGATSRTKKETPSQSLSSSAIDHTGELCPSVARLPCFELELSTMSGGFTVRIGCSW
jgi:hypothetical protein